MPDSFFASNKTKKRKRSVGSADSKPGSAKKFFRASKSSSKPSSSSRGLTGNANTNGTTKRRHADEELDSDRTDDDEAGGIDDLDLRADDEPEGSGDEDVVETPAEKRLRLAKMYLESVKEGLGACS